MTETSEFFLKEKPVLALVTIEKSHGETYCGEVCESIDSTYSHTVKIISRMKELDLLRTRKKGRKKMIKLTEKGREQALIFIELLRSYEREGLDDFDGFEKGKLSDNSIGDN